MKRPIPYLDTYVEALPASLHRCRACPKPVGLIRRRPYCVSCWKRLPSAIKTSIIASMKRSPSRLAQAIARRTFAKADAILKNDVSVT